jgi:hypothetical protein
MEDYEKEIISEDGFAVVLSNKGEKIKENPNPLNYEGKEVECLFCGKITTSIYAVCGSCRKKKMKILHERDWLGMLVYPDGRVERAPPHYKITEWLIDWGKSAKDENRLIKLDEFFLDLLKKVVGKIPDATTLQKKVRGEIKDSRILHPDQIVEMTKSMVDEHFPLREFAGVLVGKEKVPIRVAAALVAIAYICEESNRGDFWWFNFYRPKYGKPKRGSAYMPFVYYLLRRWTEATPEQARMCLKG